MTGLLLHPGVVPAELWQSWSLEAGVVLPMIAGMLLYARGLRRLWLRAGEGHGVRTWEAWCFAAGMLVLVGALVSPLHALGGALFSAHMTQHVLLMGVAAPLLVMGAPLIAFTWALPRHGRRTVSRVLNSQPLHATWYSLTRPFVASLLHGAAIWVWHAPALYAASVTSETVHAAQHASFMLSALLFWWAMRERARHGVAVLYVFATAVHSTLLGALLAFAHDVFYTPYIATAPAWGLTPLEDQQIGGLIMWVPGGLIYLAAAMVLFASWLRHSQRGVTGAVGAAAAASA